jgi:hypothetical protein
MSFLTRKIKLLFAATSVFAAALAVTVNFTDACRLDNVSIDDESIGNWSDRFDMLAGGPVVGQPLETLAASLLSVREIHKVDISVSWPHSLEVRTNEFEPTCFLLDDRTDVLFGLDRDARVIPVERISPDWEQPVITGCSAGTPFKRASDSRMITLVRLLQKLRDENVDLFRMIDEINMKATGYVKVTLAGLPYSLRVNLESLDRGLARFVEFSSRYRPDLDGVEHVDLRYDNMVICRR